MQLHIHTSEKCMPQTISIHPTSFVHPLVVDQASFGALIPTWEMVVFFACRFEFDELMLLHISYTYLDVCAIVRCAHACKLHQMLGIMTRMACFHVHACTQQVVTRCCCFGAIKPCIPLMTAVTLYGGTIHFRVHTSGSLKQIKRTAQQTHCRQKITYLCLKSGISPHASHA